MGLEPSLLEAEGKLLFKADANTTSDKIVFSDGIHPTEAGGYMYAGTIARSLKKMEVKSTNVKHSIPEPMLPDQWEDAQMLSPEIAAFSGDWVKTNPETDLNLGKFSPWFPYVMKSEKPGSSFSFTFKGNKIGIFDIGGPEAGQFDIVVDGKKIKPLNRFNGWCNNRYRGQYDFIDLTQGVHHVEFSISSEIPDKKAILGVSKAADITANPEKYNRSVMYLGKILIRGEIVK